MAFARRGRSACFGGWLEEEQARPFVWALFVRLCRGGGPRAVVFWARGAWRVLGAAG